MRKGALAVCLCLIQGPGVVFAEGAVSDFGWTLSASSSDPFVNTGATSPATLTLYLWLFCSEDTSGVSSSHFRVSGLPSVPLVSVVPRSGVTVDSLSLIGDLELSYTGCPRGARVVCDLEFDPFSGSEAFEICFFPSGWEKIFATHGCATPTESGLNSWIGYSQLSGAPCSSGISFFDQCRPSPVAASSWGNVKALYRVE